MPVRNMEWTADRTSVGRYELSREVINEISEFHPLSPSREVSTVSKSMSVYGDLMYSGNPQRPEVRRGGVTVKIKILKKYVL